MQESPRPQSSTGLAHQRVTARPQFAVQVSNGKATDGLAGKEEGAASLPLLPSARGEKTISLPVQVSRCLQEYPQRLSCFLQKDPR